MFRAPPLTADRIQETIVAAKQRAVTFRKHQLQEIQNVEEQLAQLEKVGAGEGQAQAGNKDQQMAMSYALKARLEELKAQLDQFQQQLKVH